MVTVRFTIKNIPAMYYLKWENKLTSGAIRGGGGDCILLKCETNSLFLSVIAQYSPQITPLTPRGLPCNPSINSDCATETYRIEYNMIHHMGKIS